jgi:hypothetical protein
LICNSSISFSGIKEIKKKLFLFLCKTNYIWAFFSKHPLKNSQIEGKSRV